MEEHIFEAILDISKGDDEGINRDELCRLISKAGQEIDRLREENKRVKAELASWQATAELNQIPDVQRNTLTRYGKMWKERAEKAEADLQSLRKRLEESENANRSMAAEFCEHVAHNEHGNRCCKRLEGAVEVQATYFSPRLYGKQEFTDFTSVARVRGNPLNLGDEGGWVKCLLIRAEEA